MIKQIMVRFAQISFKLHEHVVCSSFELRAYFIKKNKKKNKHSKHGTKHIYQHAMHERV